LARENIRNASLLTEEQFDEKYNYFFLPNYDGNDVEYKNNNF